jgi:hypothetical protein
LNFIQNNKDKKNTNREVLNANGFSHFSSEDGQKLIIIQLPNKIPTIVKNKEDEPNNSNIFFMI